MSSSKKTPTRNRKHINLSGFNLKTSNEVFEKKFQNKYVVKKGVKIFGKVEKNSSMIVKSGLRNNQHSFVEDTHKLPKNLKNKMAKEFYDNKRRVLYLVEK